MPSFNHWQGAGTSYDCPMLRYLQFESAQTKMEWYRELLSSESHSINLKAYSLVVLDISRKIDLQNRLMGRWPALPDEQVLRVHELWARLHRRLFPDHKIVSRDFLRLSIKNFLKSQSDLSFIHSESDGHIMDWMDFAHPLFLHPQGDDVVEKWRESGQEHLYLWWKISKGFFHHCLQNNWVSSTWLSSLLTTAEPVALSRVWPRGWIIDIGAQVSQVEMDLIESYAQVADVVVLMPDAKTLAHHPSLDRLYGTLRGRYPQGALPASHRSLPTSEEFQVCRLPTPLSEVKSAVAILRSALDAGWSTSQLTVLSPQIEKYWPCLRQHLQKEGIPVQKDVVTRLTAVLPIHQWLAKLNSMGEKLDFAELETALAADRWEWRSEVFRAVFRNLTDSNDLHRLEAVQRAWSRALESIDQKSELNIQDFLKIALTFWKSSDADMLIGGLQRFADATPSGVRLVFRDWVSYLQNSLHRMEVLAQPGNAQGVRVGNLALGESSLEGFRIYLGLQDSAFQGERVSFNGALELQRMFSELGFVLKHPEEVVSDFDLDWQLSERRQPIHLLASDYSFEGLPEMPHPFILRFKDQWKTSPETSRWDELQRGYVPAIPKGVSAEWGAVGLSRQVGVLSATSLERFIQCPFLYSVAKDFRLLDEPEADLDPDARAKGAFIHQLFEKVVREPGFPDRMGWGMGQALLFVESHRNQDIDTFLWESQRQRFAQILMRFIAYETERREADPGWSVLETEHEVRADFDLSGLRWYPAQGDEAPEGRVRFRGRIDRIDALADGFHLYDYKTSRKSEFSFSNWVKTGHIQLLVYATLLEDLGIKGRQRLAGASYYSYRPLDARAGFRVDQWPKGFSDPKWREESQAARTLIRDLILRLQRGEYLPHPLQKEKCQKCNWKGTCRAEHLA